MKLLHASIKPIIIFFVMIMPILACTYSDDLMMLNENSAEQAPAPDFIVTTFDGQTVQLNDFRGKVVVLNFWAGWCVPCLSQLTTLQATWEQYQLQNSDVVFIGIAYADNNPSSIQSLADYSVTYLNAPDIGTQISDAYGITGVPEIFVIDRHGNIAEHAIGDITTTQLIEWVDTALEGDIP
jgi:peroxiredoxin